MRIARPTIFALLAALCLAARAGASGLLPPTTLERRTPAPPDPDRWVSLCGLLPAATPPPARDPLAHTITFDTRPKLTLVPGFSQAKCGARTTSLSRPVIYYKGNLFINKADAPRIRKLLSPCSSARKTAPARWRNALVVVDPGHGGRDPGAIAHGLREKDINLRIAKYLRPILEAHGFEVHLTRSDDRFISLEERAAITNGLAADFFISVHANAETTHTVTGIETFYCDRSSRYDPVVCGLYAADRWKLDGLKLGLAYQPTHEMLRILYGLLIEDARYQSRKLAGIIQRSMVESTGAPSRGAKPGPYRVLRLANCPAVLVETGFMSNRYEARKLADPAYRKRLAESIAHGLVTYAAVGYDGSKRRVRAPTSTRR